MIENAHFFTSKEEKKIIKSIKKAEAQTSGEIRVHISQKPDGDSLERAVTIFNELKMYNTKHRNAILIHISTHSKTFAIYGDEGIHKKVSNDFWNEVRDGMLESFQQGKICKGICKAVEKVGHSLKHYFPVNENNANELSNEVTYDA